MTKCACGKTALYRVNKLGFCSDHRSMASSQIIKTPQLGSKALRIAKERAKPKDKPIPTPKTRKQAKEELREKMAKEPTVAEYTLLELLRSSTLKHQFDFQPMLMGYIPDFLFPRSKLIVEADGWHHFTTAGKRADARRTWHLEQKGYYVLRFQNKEIMELPEVTLDTIAAIHRARLNHDVCP